MKRSASGQVKGKLKAAKTVSPASIVIFVDDERWRTDKRALRLVRRAAALALVQAKARGGRDLAILLADNGRLKALNHDFRGRPKATNVLSFPGQGHHLGDIALAYGVIAREARAQSKSFAAHAAHLSAHGVLHLLGYDHQDDRQAKRMEALETAIMRKLGFPDPYAPKGKAA
jgi:probable rRNA maturation factor